MVIVKAMMMFHKGIAVLALTRQGVKIAVKIKDVLSKMELKCTIFAPKKYAQEGIAPLDKKLRKFIKDIFDKVSAIVAIMAIGIIVRTIAPCLKSKISDPAIVGVDDSGRFVISLLSGHYGGANELTRLIADGIGAMPVISTASDVMGKKSVEELARNLHCGIENLKSLPAVNSVIVNEERLVMVLTGDVKIPMSNIWDFEIKMAERAERAIEIVNDFDAGIIITKEEILKNKLKKPATILKPWKITIGIGARKDVSENKIIEAVNFALMQVNIPLERVNCLATIDIKKDSPSIINATKRLGLKLELISIDALRSFKHPDLSPDSKLVEQKIGVGGVCERVALMVAGEKAWLILKKIKTKGVTVAIAEGE
ncbi:MAG: cobalamin biosynthesis protein [archaeon]|nr:cobalamin biosynthesis protein [archaeon]